MGASHFLRRWILLHPQFLAECDQQMFIVPDGAHVRCHLIGQGVRIANGSVAATMRLNLLLQPCGDVWKYVAFHSRFEVADDFVHLSWGDTPCLHSAQHDRRAAREKCTQDESENQEVISPPVSADATEEAGTHGLVRPIPRFAYCDHSRAS